MLCDSILVALDALKIAIYATDEDGKCIGINRPARVLLRESKDSKKDSERSGPNFLMTSPVQSHTETIPEESCKIRQWVRRSLGEIDGVGSEFVTMAFDASIEDPYCQDALEFMKKVAEQPNESLARLVERLRENSNYYA